MLRTLALFALFLVFSFFAAFLFSPALMILGTTASTHLKVLEINNPNNLKVDFSDSLRSDDDFVFYEFRLYSAEPLTLKRLTISEEGTENKKEFAPSLAKNGSISLAPLENNAQASEGALISGSHSLTTRENFAHDYTVKEQFFIAELTDEYHLNTAYEFEEGTIEVQYLFSDKEVHAFWFLFCLLSIFITVLLTALYAFVFRLSKT